MRKLQVATPAHSWRIKHVPHLPFVYVRGCLLGGFENQHMDSVWAVNILG
jgi:hypothetical protein